MVPFADRIDAGRRLAEALDHLAGRADVVVLGLARGGVPVAAQVARRLKAPLDVLVVRKLGVPGREELALGAIAGGVRVLDEEIVTGMGIAEREIDAIAEREGGLLAERERRYRGERGPLQVEGRTVVLIDDGLATGSTMRAAIESMRRRGAAAIVVAIPVAPRRTCAALESEVDELVCLAAPARFVAVGRWYENFTQTSDEDVCELLASAGVRASGA